MRNSKKPRRSTSGDPADVKSTWCVDGGVQRRRAHHVKMLVPKSRSCNSQCPWLVANHGRTVKLFYDHEVPDIAMPESGYTYAPWKRARIWENDLKDGVHGYGSLCHVRLPGTRLKPDKTWEIVSRQCSGALVMQQREVLRHVERGESALTPEGAARVASDMLGREVPEHELSELDLRELIEHAHPSLLDPKIGSDAVARPLSKREIHKWDWLRRRHK